MSTNVFSGARAVFRVNGDKVAFASGCDGTEEIMYEPVEVMDNLEVQEHVPVGYRVNFSCSIFRTIKGAAGARTPREGVFGSLKEMKFFPRAGADLFSVLTSGALTCTIEDRVTKKVIMTLEECKASSSNWSITARGIVGTNVSWVAIRMKDETGG